MLKRLKRVKMTPKVRIENDCQICKVAPRIISLSDCHEFFL